MSSPFWFEFVTQSDSPHGKVSLCGLCGNTGVIRMSGVKSPAGFPVPPVTKPCICPNGRAIKRHGGVTAAYLDQLNSGL